MIGPIASNEIFSPSFIDGRPEFGSPSGSRGNSPICSSDDSEDTARSLCLLPGASSCGDEAAAKFDPDLEEDEAPIGQLRVLYSISPALSKAEKIHSRLNNPIVDSFEP
mmetsp:Transcript_4226/g.7052  ORF Transcript_4226/g.7052 Transcript_4226/m.7052 type:complete len:109 (+) Transcript_4226:489-815(+)